MARCTVARLMTEIGLAGAVRGMPVKTTISNPATPCPEDRVNRQFHAPRKVAIRNQSSKCPGIYELMPLVSVVANFTSTANIAFDAMRHILDVYCLARSTSMLFKKLGAGRGARVMDVEQMTNRTICGPNQSESPERLLTHQAV